MNIKYTIEDNLDFKTEMAAMANMANVPTCLISQQPLTKSHITLPCSHTFNYMPLYRDVFKQKQKNLLEVCTLKINQIKCPYCRVVTEQLLPYLPSECTDKCHGVNSPLKYGMPLTLNCEWKKCQKVAQYIGDTSYCKGHYKKVQQKEAQLKEASVWSTEMDNYYKTQNVTDLKQLLRQHKFKVGGNKRELVERIFANQVNI